MIILQANVIFIFAKRFLLGYDEAQIGVAHTRTNVTSSFIFGTLRATTLGRT